MVCNTPERAAALYRALPDVGPERLLVHGRFRAVERADRFAALNARLGPEGRIVVSTQVVEAGVNLDAHALWTEVAPWPSLVQRFGRCNRTGRAQPALVHWVDVPDPAPYQPTDLEVARQRLRDLEGGSVAPADLHFPLAPPVPWLGSMLRRVDLLGLFDTSPDLSGNDLDVTAFIDAETPGDVFVFWRRWDPGAPGGTQPIAEELCPVPLAHVRQFMGRARGQPALRFDHLLGEWVDLRPADLRPGHVVLLHAESGGYSPAWGWTGDARDAPVPEVPRPAARGRAPVDGDDTPNSDPQSHGSTFQTIAAHTDRVAGRLAALLAALSPSVSLPRDAESLRLAARYHDAGKSHPEFQRTMQRCGAPATPGVHWAKAPGRGMRHQRSHFRHELVSLVQFLEAQGWRSERDVNLAAYLVLAHHGKARLVIRGFPDEASHAGTRCVLGVQHGEEIPGRVDLGAGISLPAYTLALDLVELGCDGEGRPSWLERVLGLRDRADLGPFRLAYLEALLRAADARADEVAAGELSGAAPLEEGEGGAH